MSTDCPAYFFANSLAISATTDCRIGSLVSGVPKDASAISFPIKVPEYGATIKSDKSPFLSSVLTISLIEFLSFTFVSKLSTFTSTLPNAGMSFKRATESFCANASTNLSPHLESMTCSAVLPNVKRLASAPFLVGLKVCNALVINAASSTYCATSACEIIFLPAVLAAPP